MRLPAAPAGGPGPRRRLGAIPWAWEQIAAAVRGRALTSYNKC
jgi:hypothetical protein